MTALLSAAVETAQIYAPSRTPSVSDFCAEQTGAAAGIALWAAYGQALMLWAQRASRDRQPPGLAVRVLAAYVGISSIARLFPFDATLEVHQLAQRMREGRIVLTPFAGGDSPTRILAEAVLAIPIGALASLGWPLTGRRRDGVTAVAAALLFTGAIGLAQGMIDSQTADITRVVAGAAGALCGAAIALALSCGTARRQRSESAA